MLLSPLRLLASSRQESKTSWFRVSRTTPWSLRDCDQPAYVPVYPAVVLYSTNSRKDACPFELMLKNRPREWEQKQTMQPTHLVPRFALVRSLDGYRLVHGFDTIFHLPVSAFRNTQKSHAWYHTDCHGQVKSVTKPNCAPGHSSNEGERVPRPIIALDIVLKLEIRTPNLISTLSLHALNRSDCHQLGKRRETTGYHGIE